MVKFLMIIILFYEIATYFDWAEPFSLSKEQLKKIIQNFQNEMNKGLLELSSNFFFFL